MATRGWKRGWKRGWYWPWLLAAGLLGIVGVNTVMLFVANSDLNGAVVEPDYYRKAIAWDSTMALNEESNALGWSANVSLWREGGAAKPAAVTSADSGGAVAVQLQDASGEAVTGAAVSVTLIHNADAGHPISLRLATRTSPGEYSAAAPLVHNGLWEVRVDARRAGAHYARTLHAELAPAPSTMPTGATPR